MASVITGRWSGAASSLLVSPIKASVAKARTLTVCSGTTTVPGACFVPTPGTRPGTTRQTKTFQELPGPHGLVCILITLIILCPSIPSQKTCSSSTGFTPSSPSHCMPGLESEPLYLCAHQRRSHSCTLEEKIELEHI